MDRRSRDESMKESTVEYRFKKRTYGGVFTKFDDMTSMSGVGYIKNSKLIIARIIWCVLLVGALGALSIHLWYLLSQFYSYPKTAKVNLGFANLRFPEITICNINPVSKRRLSSYESASVEPLKRLVEAMNPKNLAPEQFNDSMSFDDILDIYASEDFDYYEDFWNDYESADFYDHYDNSEGFYEYAYEYYTDSSYGSDDVYQSDDVTDQSDRLSDAETDESDRISDAETDESDRISDVENDESDRISDAETDESDRISDVETDQSDRISDIETDQSDRISDVETDQSDRISDVETDQSDGISDVENDQSDGISDVETDQSDRKSDVLTDQSDGISGVETDHSDGISDVETDHSDGISDVETDHSNGISDIETDHSDGVSDVETDHSDGISDVETDQSDGISDVETDLSDGISDVETDHIDGVSDVETDQSDGISDVVTDQSGGIPAVETDQSDGISDVETGQSDGISDVETDHSDGISDVETDQSDGITDVETDPNDGIADDGNVKKKRRRRYASLYDAFNFTEFDPLFEDWFRHKNEDLLSPNEYGATIDTAAKIDALFRKTFMKLARWERGRLGHNITKMLLKCTFAGRKCDENKKLFRLHQTPEYGNCWTLSAPKFVANDAGPNAGLSMVINLQSTDYLHGMTHGYGARIQIHNYGAYPDPYQDGFSVPASMETSIGLKLVTFDRLSGIYGDCEDGKDFAKKYKRPYTRRTCQIFCHATRIIETCGCFDDFSEEVAVKTGQGLGLTACSTEEQYDCVNRIEKAFETKELSCFCRNPCSESAYTKSITNHQWPTDEHAKLLLAGICAEDSDACKSFLKENNTISSVFNNFLKLNIYYEDLNYEEIKEEADIEIAQILSDVGGAVGLWIGLSVMSFCEVIQLVIELIKLTRHKIRDNSRQSRRKYRKRKAYQDADEESLRKVVPFCTQFGEPKGNSNGPGLHRTGNGSLGENIFSFSSNKKPYEYNVFRPYDNGAFEYRNSTDKRHYTPEHSNSWQMTHY